MIGRRAGLVHLVAQLVAVDADRSQSLQPPGDGALAAAAASGQADHVREEGEVGCVLGGQKPEQHENRNTPGVQKHNHIHSRINGREGDFILEHFILIC